MIMLSNPTDRHISLQDLAALPTPKGRTRTHYPLPHIDVANTIRRGIMDRLSTWEIDPADVESDYVVSGENAERMFALFTFKSKTGINSCVAGKNAHDMRFPMVVAGGKSMSVCTNLDLFPAVQSKRKHTKHIIDQYRDIIHMGLDAASGTWKAQDARYQAWRDAPLGAQQVDHLLMSSMREGVIPPSKLANAYNQYQTPEFAEYGSGTAWTAHNAVTHVLRGSNPHHLARKTTALGSIIDAILDPVVEPQSEILWDVEPTAL